MPASNSNVSTQFISGRLLGEEVVQRGIELGSAVFGRQSGSACSRRALLYLGRATEALDEIPVPQHMWSNGGVFAAQRAMCLAHAGRRDQAMSLLKQFREARDFASADDPSPAIFLRYLLDAAVAAQDIETLAVIYPRMHPLSDLLITEANHAYCIGRSCGGAAALLGEPSKARGYYQQAIEACEKIHFRPELALTRLELAELLLDHYPAERAEALAHLDFAIAECRDMKMQPALERALRRRELLSA